MFIYILFQNREYQNCHLQIPYICSKWNIEASTADPDSKLGNNGACLDVFDCIVIHLQNIAGKKKKEKKEFYVLLLTLYSESNHDS